MSKTLADLRAQRHQQPRRPERSLTVCLAPDLVAEVQALDEESRRLKPVPTEEPEKGPPRRQGERVRDNPRMVEIRERLAVLFDEMEQHEGEIRLRANRTDGEWRRWVNEHPPRNEDEPGHDRDQRVAYGTCDADALLDDLATYAHAWDGEELGPSDFAELIEPNLATADKAEMAQAVVTMYESRLDFPRWRSALSANLQRSSASTSLSRSGSPTAGSTDGSPAQSRGATTKKAAKSA
jgi:hypothetical protein